LNGSFNVKNALKAKSDELKTSLGMQLGHPVSQGDLSEAEWLDFLNGFLPKRYAASKGFVFDSTGGTSDQIDVIIYDPLHSPLIMETKNGEKYVTAESVYAIFEVKQDVNKDHIKYANEKIKSVLDLKRTSRGMISAGVSVPARGLTPIIGGLLAVRSDSKPETVENNMLSYPHIDIICAAQDGTFHKCGNEVQSSNGEEAVFSFFYVLLDELFKLGTVAAIDIRDYADLSLESFKIAR
jgi:hypothetical protein